MRLKRVISAALAVSMAVSMMPAAAVPAFAAGTSTNTAVTTTAEGEKTTVDENAPISGIVVQRMFSGHTMNLQRF